MPWTWSSTVRAVQGAAAPEPGFSSQTISPGSYRARSVRVAVTIDIQQFAVDKVVVGMLGKRGRTPMGAVNSAASGCCWR